jgi:hypothetical protein
MRRDAVMSRGLYQAPRCFAAPQEVSQMCAHGGQVIGETLS